MMLYAISRKSPTGTISESIILPNISGCEPTENVNERFMSLAICFTFRFFASLSSGSKYTDRALYIFCLISKSWARYFCLRASSRKSDIASRLRMIAFEPSLLTVATSFHVCSGLAKCFFTKSFCRKLSFKSSKYLG